MPRFSLPDAILALGTSATPYEAYAFSDELSAIAQHDVRPAPGRVIDDVVGADTANPRALRLGYFFHP